MGPILPGCALPLGVEHLRKSELDCGYRFCLEAAEIAGIGQQSRWLEAGHRDATQASFHLERASCLLLVSFCKQGAENKENP